MAAINYCYSLELAEYKGETDYLYVTQAHNGRI